MSTDTTSTQFPNLMNVWRRRERSDKLDSAPGEELYSRDDEVQTDPIPEAEKERYGHYIEEQTEQQHVPHAHVKFEEPPAVHVTPATPEVVLEQPQAPPSTAVRMKAKQRAAEEDRSRYLAPDTQVPVNIIKRRPAKAFAAKAYTKWPVSRIIGQEPTVQLEVKTERNVTFDANATTKLYRSDPDHVKSRVQGLQRELNHMFDRYTGSSTYRPILPTKSFTSVPKISAPLSVNGQQAELHVKVPGHTTPRSAEAISPFHEEEKSQEEMQPEDLDRTMSLGELRLYWPHMDMFESSHQLTVLVDMPGMRPSDIDVIVGKDNVMTISGERRFLRAGYEGAPVRLREHVKGTFKRSFKMPYGARTSDVTAMYVNGQLRVAIPKTVGWVAGPKTRRIRVVV